MNNEYWLMVDIINDYPGNLKNEESQPLPGYLNA